MTYALYTYKVIDTFEHQTNIDRWYQGDADVESFILHDDAWIGDHSAKFTHETNTNSGYVQRCFSLIPREVFFCKKNLTQS